MYSEYGGKDKKKGSKDLIKEECKTEDHERLEPITARKEGTCLPYLEVRGGKKPRRLEWRRRGNC